jgi:hypothetical protein
MKKIINKKLQTVLLRGAVAASGTMCTAVVCLFTSTFYGFLTVGLLGVGLTSLIIECVGHDC